MADLPARVLFGAAYYHEYQPAYGPDVRPTSSSRPTST
jgi:beta-galactosidase